MSAADQQAGLTRWPSRRFLKSSLRRDGVAQNLAFHRRAIPARKFDMHLIDMARSTTRSAKRKIIGNRNRCADEGKGVAVLANGSAGPSAPKFPSADPTCAPAITHGCLTKLGAASTNRNEYSAGNVRDATVGVNVCA
jgi:hypothetical protein